MTDQHASGVTGPEQTWVGGWHGVGRESALLAKGVTTVLELARPLASKKRDSHPMARRRVLLGERRMGAYRGDAAMTERQRAA